MSAVTAHYVSPPDRRYAHDIHYDPQTFLHYSQPSLNAVTASGSSLDATTYALGSTPAPSSYVWDTAYPTSSSTLAPNTTAFSSSSHPAPSGPPSLSNLSTYAPDYRSPLASRPSGAFHVPSSSSPALASPPSRSAYPSAARSYSALASATAPAHSVSPPSSRLQHATWQGSPLYTIEPADPITPPPSVVSPAPSSPPPTPIKSEDPDGEFIIEVSVPAEPVSGAMPEVPLRATHAVPEMKRMMYAFRLENFAMHDGIKSAATQPGSGGIEVGPLKERPVEIEWQVQLDAPLVADSDDTFRYGHAQAKAAAARRPALYRADTPVSPRQSARGSYPSAGSPSPALSIDYPSAVDNDAWDTSSAYGSVAGNSSGSASASTSSPTFASVMTPAQGLGWSMRGYQAGDVEMEQSTYRRAQPSAQSLSRVSQPHGQYLLSGSSKPLYQQSSQYAGYESSGYSRGSSSSRYPQEVYASSSSTWGYRT